MLGTLRKHTHSWAARGLLLVLAASFGLWGIGDIFRGGHAPPVATVGSVDIMAAQFSAQFRQEVDRLQRQSGATFTTAQAVKAGLHYQVLGRLVRDALLEQEAKRLGLVVPDAAVRQAITGNPAFQDEQGRFDAQAYRLILSRSGLTPERYEALVRREKTIAALQGTVVAPPPVPAAWIDAIYRYRAERRVAEYLFIANDAQRAQREPDAAEIEAFHRENAAFFTAPEYRELTYLELTPDAMLDDIELSPDDLFYEYQARLDSYQRPERRRVEQIRAPDRESADAVSRMLQSGKGFAETAAALADQGVSHLDLGLVTRDSLFPDIAPTIFGLGEGGVSRPLETGLGWLFFWVRAIEPASTKSFDEVKDELAVELRRTMARDGLYKFANRIEDSLAGGASLEEAAAKLGLETVHVPAIDQTGANPQGAPVAGLPEVKDFLSIAFTTEPGFESNLIEDAEGDYLILRVDSVTPPALRPLDEVRASVIETWKAAQRAKSAQQLAEDARARLEQGGDLATIAAELGAAVQTSEPLTRDARGQADGRLDKVLDGLFALEPDRPGAVMGPAPGGFVVARLEEVLPADPSADAGATAKLADNLTTSLSNDLLTQYQAALEARYPISIDLDAVNAMF